MESLWRIEMLGGLRVVQGDRVITRFRTQKTGCLLAYLACQSVRHARDALGEMFWPGVEPSRQRNGLSLALSSIRRQLEPPDIPQGAVLVTDRFFVQLNPDAFTTDVSDFRAALRMAAHSPSGAERARHTRRALDLYRGEMLSGYYENWAVRYQDKIAEEFQEASHWLVGYLVLNGDAETALKYARHAVETDAFFREEAHEDLIRALASSGRFGEAVRCYRSMEEMLAERLGSRPSAEAQRLMREIERRTSATSSSPSTPTASSPAASVPRSPPLAAGTVTLLLVDGDGTDRHAGVLRGLIRQHGGRELEAETSPFTVAFARAADALACALAAQRRLAADKGADAPQAVRVALHTGDMEAQKSGYPGMVMDEAARLLLAAHPGQALCSEATAVLLRPHLEPGARLTDLGVFSLARGSPPERLFQVDAPGGPPRAFPPLNAERACAGHLPVSLTRFFGREPELAHLCEMLASQGTRLVTVTGPGGTGKTRLSLEAARQLLDAYQGAVWFVALAGLSDPHLIVGAAADALGLTRSAGVDPLDQAIEALGRQRSLLVLDNFEHLVEGGAGVVRTLLERAPSLTCLITSRHKLILPGEREFPVRPLPVPEEWQPPEELVRNESVRLFVDRAQSVRADFQVTERNAASVGALCSRLEGIPLAIELAAARAPVISIARMLEQLDHRFDALAARGRAAEGRHGTLRAAMDWSYDLLSPDLRRFFARLSVFRGGWTVEAAETVCEEARPLDSLAQLMACSLVLSDATADGMRFRMLETLREYGWERLAEDERQELALRHADHYLRVAIGEGDQSRRLENRDPTSRLDAEHDNFHAVITWATTPKGSAEIGLRTLIAVTPHRLRKGDYKESSRQLEELLALPGNASRTPLRAEALRLAAGAIEYYGSDLETAWQYADESLAICREQRDVPGVASSLHVIGKLAGRRHQYATSQTLLRESLTLWEQQGNIKQVAAVRTDLGVTAVFLSDLVTAREQYHKALEIFEATGDHIGQANISILLASIEASEGYLPEARSHYERALAIWKAAGSPPAIALVLNYLGNVAWRSCDMGTAWDTYSEALSMWRGLGQKRGIGISLCGLADVLRCRGDHEMARPLLEEAVSLLKEAAQEHLTASALDSLGEAMRETGEMEAARACHIESAKLRLYTGTVVGGAPLERLAALAWGEGNAQEAAKLFGTASAVREMLHLPQPLPEIPAQERCIAAVRSALGVKAFTAAWEEGRATAAVDVLTALVEGSSPA